MELLPGWKEFLARKPDFAAAAPTMFRLPQCTSFYSGRITLVDNRTAADQLVELASQRPMGWIGMAFGFCYARPGVAVDQKHIAHDPSAIQPLTMGLALAELHGADNGELFRFAVDLRGADVLPAVRELLRLPLPSALHDARDALFCIWRLGLPEPVTLWDTQVCEKCLALGKNHRNYRLELGADLYDQVRVAEEIEQEDTIQYSLAATCLRYEVSYPGALVDGQLRAAQATEVPFSKYQCDVVSAAAAAAAQLYPHQCAAALRAGILGHLQQVEMPWTVTNARMKWRGVRKDAEKCRRIEQACHNHLTDLKKRLQPFGIANVRSHDELERFFASKGLVKLFRKGGRACFDRDLLATFEDRDPAIPFIRAARRIHELLDSHLLTDLFVGADGRVHPDHRQLGAHTGRNTCRWPNVGSVGRLFRPLIVPEAGQGIGEVDLSQIEIGVTAAVYHDPALVEMFNTGDAYAAMALQFYKNELPAEDQLLSPTDFKQKYRQHRDRMKKCTLGIIYGLTAFGLAQYLNIPEHQAAALQERFLAMFPALVQARADAATYGGLRGYAMAVTGLRRLRAPSARELTNWERNWMTNFPVQGSAAAVFKVAGNRLDKHYRQYDAWLIIPMHDAYVFEAPLEVMKEVAELTGRVLCDAVQEQFHELRPKVEVNISNPTCWNKDGRADSIDRWMECPMFTF